MATVLGRLKDDSALGRLGVGIISPFASRIEPPIVLKKEGIIRRLDRVSSQAKALAKAGVRLETRIYQVAYQVLDVGVRVCSCSAAEVIDIITCEFDIRSEFE